MIDGPHVRNHDPHHRFVRRGDAMLQIIGTFTFFWYHSAFP